MEEDRLYIFKEEKSLETDGRDKEKKGSDMR